MTVTFRTQPTIFESMKAYMSEVSDTITDFNVGSIVNSFFFSVSNAIASLYTTLQNVYSATFVATAESEDLDDRVADFGLSRRVSTRSSGYITFFKATQTFNDIIISAGTRVKTITTNLIKGIEFGTTIQQILPAEIDDEAHTYYTEIDEYALDSRRVYDVTSIAGTVSGFSGHTFTKDTDYELDTTDESAAQIVWLTGGQLPDDSTPFITKYFPLSVDIPIQSLGIGAETNVAQETIINIASRPAGIDGVINYDQTSGGTDQETDVELRERVPLFLSSLSKATKNALRAAALSIDGVKNATIIEYTPPNGLVGVFIDDGNGSAPPELIREVKDVIQGTINGVENDTDSGVIAAGIGVNVSAPTLKLITIEEAIVLNVGFDQTIVTNEIETDVSIWLSGFATGAQVIRADLIKVIKSVEGVYNIDLETLSINGLTTGDTFVDQNQTARLDTITTRVTTGTVS